MKIIEIAALENGAHNNQTIDGATIETFSVPEGWAVVPKDLATENFPFGEIAVDETQTPPVVTAWSPLPVPEPEPIPEPESKDSVWDELDAAYQEGVDSV